MDVGASAESIGDKAVPSVADRAALGASAAFRTIGLSSNDFKLATFLVFIVFAAQAMLPTYNGDDYAHLQYPESANSFFGQLRWGYFVVFYALQGTSPLPLLSTLVASLLMVATFGVAARCVGLASRPAVVLFVLISSISIFWQENASFDSTRVAYPLGNALAVGGIALVLAGRGIPGTLLMSFAPAFYTASIELAATLLVAALMCRIMVERWPAVLRSLAAGTLALLSSLVLFLAVTRGLFWLFDIHYPPGKGVALDAAAHRIGEVAATLAIFAVPVANWLPAGGRLYQYFPDALAVAVLCAMASFLVFLLRRAWARNGPPGVAVAALLFAAGLVAPMFLMFGNAEAYFSSRSFFAYSLLHAYWLTAVLDHCLLRPAHSRSALAAAVLALLATTVVASSAVHIGRQSFNEHLSTQSDLLETNRIIARIDDVLARHPDVNGEAVPLVVVFERAVLSGPVGGVTSARSAPWSREAIFHWIDRRFVWVRDQPERYERAYRAAASHGEWPADDSVFVEDGVVVVVVKK